MINSNVFSYINVLDKAADAAWLRNEAISNNLANVDTPNYKRQDVSFEDELIRNLNKVEHRTMDAKVYNMYGPTETTVVCNAHLIDDGKLNIGKPYFNVYESIMVQPAAREMGRDERHRDHGRGYPD